MLRRREQRRRRHAEERHEGRVARAEVHVGQVEEAAALLDRAHQRQRTLAAREDRRVAEAQAAAPHRRVEHRVALRLVDRRAGPRLEQQDGDAGDVERHEVRHQPHHRRIGALARIRRRLRRGSAASAALRRAYHSKPRSSRLRPSHWKCSRTQRATRGVLHIGQAQLEIALAPRAGASRASTYSSMPSTRPSDACSASGRWLHSHSSREQQTRARRRVRPACSPAIASRG